MTTPTPQADALIEALKTDLPVLRAMLSTVALIGWHDDIRHMIHHIESLAAPSGWREMSSVHRDGKPFIAYSRGAVYLAKYYGQNPDCPFICHPHDNYPDYEPEAWMPYSPPNGDGNE